MHIGHKADTTRCNVGGPNYWCQNKETAVLCKAVPYCQENVWSLQQVCLSFKFVFILHIANVFYTPLLPRAFVKV